MKLYIEWIKPLKRNESPQEFRDNLVHKDNFIYLKDVPIRFRILADGAKRDVEDIHPQELRDALTKIIEYYEVISEEAIIKNIHKFLNYKSNSTIIINIIRQQL